MNNKGKVKLHEALAGYVWQDENGYWFEYTDEYFKNPKYGPVSQTLPVTQKQYHDSKSMIAFFDGLIPEGWLLDIALDNWKINEKDRMELLLTVCKECIGAISIEKE
ncbi:MAG: HipA N-terminal domain-containing protein [Bacteroidia bacterium]|nr:HipA N-terminal domain-containing protein [Bacteroidia bacterium]